MTQWVWNTSTGSWWSTNPGWSTNLGWSDDSRRNISKDEPALQEPELAARKELTESDRQAAKARRFSREVQRIELEKLIAQTERRQQRQLEYQERCASRGGPVRMTPIEYQQVPGADKAIQRQREYNQDRIRDEQRRLEHLRSLLEENLRQERDSPRLDEQLVEKATLILQ